MRTSIRLSLAAAAFALAGICSGAQATTILTFGQIQNDDPITGTAGLSGTTIGGANIPVTITQIDGSVFTPVTAYFTLSLSSTTYATVLGGSPTAYLQNFTGDFTITSLAGGAGVNYLSGHLVDIALGAGSSFTLNASTPSAANVTFTSDIIGNLALDRGAALSFVNVTPQLAACPAGDALTLCGFTSSVSGNVSAGTQPREVPEPASLLVLGVGLVSLGVARRRRRMV